jgi:hypothetical protein
MAVAVIIIDPTFKQTNDQRFQTFKGKLTVGPGTYPVGGLALDSVFLATLLPTGGTKPRTCWLASLTGSGYIYQRIDSTGNMMVLQVPPSGSLVTAAPLQQLQSGSTLSAVQADVIEFECSYLRNA